MLPLSSSRSGAQSRKGATSTASRLFVTTACTGSRSLGYGISTSRGYRGAGASAPRSHAWLPESSSFRQHGQSSRGNRLATVAASAGSPHFDLPTAVALAGCAFEAYLEPSGADGFKDRTLNGCMTTFTDQAFLTEAYEGLLYVQLTGAKGLRVADVTGSSDPYAVVSVGGSTVRSKTVLQNLNPMWGERFFLYVKDMKDLLKVRVYDADLIKSDDDLGTALVAVASLEPGKPQDLSLELKGPGCTGAVQLRATLLRFADFTLSQLDAMTADRLVVPEGGQENLRAASQQVPQMLEAAAVQQATLNSLPGGIGTIGQKMLRTVDHLSRAWASKDEEELTDEVPNPWKVLARVAGFKDSHFTPVAFVENHETDTQVLLYRNTESREAVVAFRGTEQIKWKDIATDLNLAPSSLTPERADSNAGLTLGAKLFKAVLPSQEIMVHKGFLSAYDSVRQTVVRLLDSITGTGDKGQWRVYVTGHSLGGALATLCAYELAVRQGKARQVQQLSLYTYGAPRVGNKLFAEAYNEVLPDSWRITNAKDIIPSVPRLLGYAHVKHSVRLTATGQLLVQADDSTDVFGEGRGGLDVIQELADKVQREERRFDEVFEEIKAAELQILDSLVSGKALEEHMETFYLDTLQKCVSSAGKGPADGGSD